MLRNSEGEEETQTRHNHEHNIKVIRRHANSQQAITQQHKKNEKRTSDTNMLSTSKEEVETPKEKGETQTTYIHLNKIKRRIRNANNTHAFEHNQKKTKTRNRYTHI